ncbi:hypothetical protein Tco_0349864 [Tanacetum coccineum]
MQESEPLKKIKKRVQVQMSVDEELAKKVFEEEQARFNAEQEARLKVEQEQETIDFETALELQKQLDKREEVAAKVDQAHDIDWTDPAILRYHTLQNRPFSVAEVRKNMCMYLKNQGGYKMSHFKGMSYEEIRPIFERVWDQTQSFIPMDSEKEKALQIKYPIIDWEVHSEDTMKFWKITRVGNHTEVYQVLEDILKNFNREDMDKLWSLVKERFNSPGLTDDKEKEL